MSVSGLNQQYLPNTLDGLNIVEADQVYIDGQLVNLDDLVTYENATRTLNMGIQNIQTSHNASSGNDVVNKTHLDNVVSNLSIAIQGSFLDKVTTLPQSVLGDVSFTSDVALSSKTASRVLILDDTKTITSSGISTTKLDFLGNVDSDIQTQLNGKLNLSGSNANQNIVLGSYKVQSTAMPTVDDDLVRKGYTDATFLNKTTNASQVVMGQVEFRDTISHDLQTIFQNGIRLNSSVLGNWNITVEYIDVYTQNLVFTNATSGATLRFTGDYGFIKSSGWSPSKAMITNSAGELVSSGVDSVKLTYLNGLTSDIQSQIDTKASTVYVDAQDALKLNLTGGTMTGNINMGANKVQSSAVPSTGNDYTNKTYVDSLVVGGTSTVLRKADVRSGVAPNSQPGATMSFYFGTHSNDGVTPYSDLICLNGWDDSSGGKINLLAMNKGTSAGIRQYHGDYGSTSNFSSYRDCVMTDFNSANVTLGGTLSMGSNKVTSTLTPTTNDDLSRKGYVDTQDGLRLLKSGDVAEGTIFNSVGDFHPFKNGDVNRGIVLFANNADGATYSSYNGGLASWYGIGFKSTLDGITRYVFDCRSGDSAQVGKMTASAINNTGATANRVAIYDVNKNLVSSSVTDTTLGYLDINSSLTSLLATKANLSGAAFTGGITTPNLGIGTASPGVYTLYVNGASYTNGYAYVGGNIYQYGADFYIQNTPRGAGGRALVHDVSNVLTINYGGDFASVRIDSNISIGANTITSTSNPTTADQLSRKGYVDGVVANYLPLTGGILSGALTVNGAVSVGNRFLGLPDASPTGNFWMGLRGTNAEVDRLAISIVGSQTTGVVDRVVIAKSLRLNQPTASRVLTLNASGDVTSSSVTDTTLTYLDIGSSLTGLLNLKANLAGPQTFTNTHTFSSATPITLSGLTADRVLVTNASQELKTSTVTTTTLGYLDATSSVQTQLNTKASITYVDTADGLRVLKGGDVMTGDLSNSGSFISSKFYNAGSNLTYTEASHKNQWWRIMITGPSNDKIYGEFVISYSVAGHHGFIHFRVATCYTLTPYITIIGSSFYGTPIVQKLRLALSNSDLYADGYVEMFLGNFDWFTDTIPIRVNPINQSPFNSDYTITGVITAGTTTGHTYYEVSCDSALEIAGSSTRFKINGGKVGIGISPRETLDVEGSIVTGWNNYRIGTQYNESSSGYYLGMENNTSARICAIVAQSSDSPSTGAVVFRTGSGPNERMRINAVGQVGIGTVSLTDMFQVQGTASFSGNVGIGTLSKTGVQLRLSDAIQNRKIVLYDGGFTDDHQYYGFGIMGNTLRFNVPNYLNDRFSFFGGLSTTSSWEVFRINGTGELNSSVIGVNANTTPNLKLSSSFSHIDNNAGEVWLFTGFNGHMAIGRNGNRDASTTNLVLGVAGTQEAQLISVASNNSGYKPMAFSASSYNFTNGNVAIATTPSAYRLDVNGATNVTGVIRAYGNGVSGPSPIYSQNDYNGDAYALMYLRNNSGTGCYWFLNSSGRVGDGGGNTSTIRNDIGTLRLQARNNVGVVVKADTANVGIGTDNPAYILDINTTNGSYNSSMRIRTPWAGLELDSTQGSGGRKYIVMSTVTGAGIGSGSFGIWDETAGAYRFSINSTGQATFHSWMKVENGDISTCIYGPNTTWTARLRVGSGTSDYDTTTAQVISTNGNLHLDAAKGKDTYINYYNSIGATLGSTYSYGQWFHNANLTVSGNTYFSGTPNQSRGNGGAYYGRCLTVDPVDGNTRLSQLEYYHSGDGANYYQGSWINMNRTSQFYKNVASSGQMCHGFCTGYRPSGNGAGMINISIRIYNQSTFQYFYSSSYRFTNIVDSHVTIPININFGSIPAGWYDVYVYTDTATVTDGNDFLSLTWLNLPSGIQSG